MGRRSVLLVVALVVAALGTTLVFFYVNGVNDRALAKQEPVRVLVAKKLIAAGTSVEDANDAGAFETKTISKGDTIPHALSDIEPIRGKAAGSTIYPGDQITTDKFAAAVSTSKVSLPADKISVSVDLKDPAQQVGFVTPGTHIAIFLTSTVGKNSGTRVLLTDVEVVAVGDQTAPTTTSTTSGTETGQVSNTTLTLAVDQTDYQRIVYARTHGQLSLALLPPGFTPKDLPATTDANLFPLR